MLRSWGYVYLEVDERQHQDYPEGHDALRMQRMLAEHMFDGKARTDHIVCFNPDPCIENGVRQTLPLKYRMGALVEKWVFEPVKQYTARYLCYDRSDCPLPDICLSAAYPASLHQFVLDASYVHASLAHTTGDCKLGVIL